MPGAVRQADGDCKASIGADTGTGGDPKRVVVQSGGGGDAENVGADAIPSTAARACVAGSSSSSTGPGGTPSGGLNAE